MCLQAQRKGANGNVFYQQNPISCHQTNPYIWQLAYTETQIVSFWEGTYIYIQGKLF